MSQKMYQPTNFRIVIDGIDTASFSELVAVNGIPVRPDFMQSALDRLAAERRTMSTITFRRARTTDMKLLMWYRSATQRLESSKKNGSVVASSYHNAGMVQQTVARWNFTNGWPSKWEYPASTGDVAMETITIAFESIDRT